MLSWQERIALIAQALARARIPEPERFARVRLPDGRRALVAIHEAPRWRCPLCLW